MSMIDPDPPVRPRPALYMVWESTAPHVALPLTPEYDVVALPSEEAPTIRPIVELDGALVDAAWNALVDRILPDGLFVARLAGSGR